MILIKIIAKLLCYIGLHRTRLIKFFTSTDDSKNIYYLNYYGHECLYCKTRFIKRGPDNWCLQSTLEYVENWVNTGRHHRLNLSKNPFKIVKD